MVITESIELRPETNDSDWVSCHCVICGDDLYLDLPSTPADYSEVYVDGKDTGFAVCEDCGNLSRDALAAELQDWANFVIWHKGETH